MGSPTIGRASRGEAKKVKQMSLDDLLAASKKEPSKIRSKVIAELDRRGKR